MPAPHLEPSLLADIARAAGYTVRGDGNGGLEMANPGGEIRFLVNRTDSTFEVSRAERTGVADFALSTGIADNVRRYLIMEVGADLRRARGLEPVDFPHTSDDLAPGATIDVKGMRGTLVAHGVPVATLRHNDSVSPAAQFSWIADVEPSELLASYFHVQGKPLLTKWVQPPAPSLTCDVCRAYFHAERVVEAPEKLLEIPGAFLYRCRVCNTFWIDSGGKVAQPVSREEALRVFPQLADLD